MKNYIKYFLAFVMSAFLCTGVFAQTSSTPSQAPTVGDIKSQVLSDLQKDGYLSEKMTKEVTQKYITPQDAKTQIYFSVKDASTASDPVAVQKVEAASSWTQYLSLVNFIKVLAVILLLFAFSGVIKKIVLGLWIFIVIVPVIVYQSLFMLVSLYGTIFPEQIWASQAFYIALLCSFTNLMILGWIFATHPKLEQFIEKLFNLGIPVATVASFWAMIYFGTLAIVYQSSIFGFFAAVALSGIFSFTLIYTPGTLFLYFKENMMGAVIFGHMVVLALYVAIERSGVAMPYIGYFNAGIQYYCTIALGTGLLVAASPFYKTSQAAGYALLFVLVFFASIALYFFLGMTTMATIIMIFFALFFLEWVGYIGFKTNWIVGCGFVGGILYGTAVYMEKYAPMIINNLKTVI